jgi:hypothetical protein
MHSASHIDISRNFYKMDLMEELVKFGGQMDAKKLKELRAHAKENGQKFSTILNEMAEMYLTARQIRPRFTKAMEESIAKNSKLYEKLAK